MRISRDRVVSLLVIAPSVLAVAVFVYGLHRLDRLHLDGEMGHAPSRLHRSRDRQLPSDLRPESVPNGHPEYGCLHDLFIAASLTIGLTLANLIDRQIRSEGLFRNIFVFPMAVSFIVTGVVWKWILSPGQAASAGTPATPEGLNQLFGLDPASNRWLTDAHVVYIGPDNPVYGILHDIGLGFITSPNIGIPIASCRSFWLLSGRCRASSWFCTWPGAGDT